MISHINGTITQKKKESLIVKAGGISYEVLMPRAIMQALGNDHVPGADIELVVYYYLQMEPSKAFPVLIGFMNDVEKEFFEKFISVSGVGPKASCKALSEPFSSVAGAIDSGEVGFLKKLPGIGERKAAEIIARLKGKVGKYGLIRDERLPEESVQEDTKEEALAILEQLQYKKNEAKEMINNALKRNPGVKTAEELLNEVYRDRVK